MSQPGLFFTQLIALLICRFQTIPFKTGWTRPTHGIQHEEVEPGSGAEGHEGGAAVQSVAGTHDLAARLQRVLLRGLPLRRL